LDESRRYNLRLTARLLRETFGLDQFDDERYLRWFYDENPLGAAIEEQFDQGDRRLAHLAGIPQEYHCRESCLPIVFPLHIAVDPTLRGRGMMSQLSTRCFEHARERDGVIAFVGMPNASSTRGYTNQLGFRLVKPLPVRLLLPLAPASGIRSHAVEAKFLESRQFRDLVESIDFAPGPAWSQRWTPERVRWRLAAPHASYALHVSAGAIAVSRRTRSFGLPFAALLKLYPRRGNCERRMAALVSASCRFHGAPFGVYAGWNAHAKVPGIPLPERLKTSPLNLIFRSLDAAVIHQDSMTFDTFEFLDFDAY